MEIQLRDRPDGLDKAILRYIQNAQTGVTIPEIHRAVCPRRREPLVRYRVETLNAVGLLRLIRVFGRIVVFPDDGAQPARGERQLADSENKDSRKVSAKTNLSDTARNCNELYTGEIF